MFSITHASCRLVSETMSSPWNPCALNAAVVLEIEDAHSVALEGRDLTSCLAPWATSKNLLSQPCVLVNRGGLTHNLPTTTRSIIYLRESVGFLFFYESPWHWNIFNSGNFSFLSLRLLKMQVFSYIVWLMSGTSESNLCSEPVKVAGEDCRN